ncbi:MAG: hypothetical protein FJX47_21175 [Alphaproteobacteria bacterium]|nr:hypothetical protein [Alphaproteobacteria bacterium]
MPQKIGALAGRIFGPAAFVYFALLVASLSVFPTTGGTWLDVAETENGMFNDPLAYVAHRSTKLASDSPALVFMGASNVELGFRPEQIAPLFPGVEIHNLALGLADVAAMQRLVELVYAQRAPDQRRNLVFVAGLWYGQFRQGDRGAVASLIERQARRFGLFTVTTTGIERRLPLWAFEFVVTLLRPYFLVRLATRPIGPREAFLVRCRAAAPSGEGVDPCQGIAFEKAAAEALAEAQFQALLDLATRIKSQGGRLVLLDLPVPSCSSALRDEWRQYQARKTPWFASSVAAGAILIDMQDMNADESFFDPTHPRLAARPKWAQRLQAEFQDRGLMTPRS